MDKTRVGVCKTNITPPFGIITGGNFGYGKVNYILDDLYSHAIVIETGSVEIALISVDICAIVRFPVYEQVVEGIEEQCGIKKDNVLITATHANFDPSLIPENKFYIENLIKNIITSVCMAQKKKQEVKIAAGKDINSQHVFNRRLQKPDGSIVMNFTESDFLQDCTSPGSADYEISVIRFENLAGSPLAFIVNYTLHNKAAQAEVSADFSGYMEKMLKKFYGDEVVVLYLPGASGDVNFINYKDPHTINNPELYQEIGQSLAGSVIKMNSAMKYIKVDEIGVASQIIEIPDRPYCDYDTKIDNTFGEGKNSPMFGYIEQNRELYENVKPEINKIDIHAVKIGDEIAIVTVPALLFTQYGIDIKESSSFPFTIVADLTNGAVGYVPEVKSFNEGGYEVRKIVEGNYGGSHLSINAGELISSTCINLINILK